jgi:hypothetical protein
LPNGGSEKGEAYVKGGSIKFMVTDGLNILPLSMSSTLQAVRAAQIQPGNLLENEVTLTNFQVLFFQNKRSKRPGIFVFGSFLKS